MADRTYSKEAIQRVQLGLSGLAGVVLLIGLANVIVENVRKDDSVLEVNAEASANAAEAVTAARAEEQRSEPLAELGVAPSSDADPAPVVADLQPDPNLRERMDRPQPPESAQNRQDSAP